MGSLHVRFKCDVSKVDEGPMTPYSLTNSQPVIFMEIPMTRLLKFVLLAAVLALAVPAASTVVLAGDGVNGKILP